MVQDQKFIPPLNVRYAQKVAELVGYNCEIIDTYSNYLVKISQGEQFIFVGAGGVPGYTLNDASSAGVAKDKTHTYEILRRAGLKTPKTNHFFLNNTFADLRPEGKGIKEALKFANHLGYPVFAKPNDGSRGELAQSASSDEELLQHLNLMAEKTYLGIVQEYLKGKERRIFYIDSKPIFSYYKTTPVLIGDGRSTIEELLMTLTDINHKKGLSPVNLKDPVLASSLIDQKLSLTSILPAGKELEYCEKKNVSIGGSIYNLSQNFTPEEIKLCVQVQKASRLRICAIDLLYTDDNEEPYILELNSNPSLTSLEKAGREDLLIDIWTEVIEKALLTTP